MPFVLTQTFLILRRNERDVIKNVYRSAARKVPATSCRILMKLEFSRQIFEKYSNIKFQENPSNGAELFLADGRTDMTKLIVVFRNFANAPNNVR
jgi:hypothetical protein